MAKPGKKPKNVALKVIEGNPGRRPIPEQPDLPSLGAEAPEFLTARAQLIWNRWASSLIGKGLFADVHMELLASTVQAWAMYEECMEYVAAHGVKTDDGKRRPELVTAEKHFEIARKGMSEMGLTPSELGRLPAKKKADGWEF